MGAMLGVTRLCMGGIWFCSIWVPGSTGLTTPVVLGYNVLQASTSCVRSACSPGSQLVFGVW